MKVFNVRHFLLTPILALGMHATQAAECVYTVNSQWQDGFSASISIYNDGSSPINNWSINWAYSGATQITQSWNANLTGNNPYSASNLTWNATIYPNQSVNFGFNGSGPAEIPTLNGAICESASSSSSSSSESSSSTSSSSSSESSSSSSLPNELSNADVGAVAGSGSVEFFGDQFQMSANGNALESNQDAFHYVYQSLQGNGEIIAHIVDINGVADAAKAGLMLRDDLSSESKNAFWMMHPEAGSAFQYRTQNAGNTATTWQQNPALTYDDVDLTTPYRTRYLRPSKWLRLIREDNSISAYSSDDGQCWNLRWEQSIDFGSEILAGIALTSGDTNSTATATIEDLSVNSELPQDINADCLRAQVDGEIAPPSEWKSKPGILGGDTWSITTQDPNPLRRPKSCREASDPWRKQMADDHSTCPEDTLTAAWAQPGYDFSTGNWQHDQLAGFAKDQQSGVNTIVDTGSLWLRKEITLSQSDIDALMFWGRWDNGVSIYVNGVLATNVYRNNQSRHYRYLGMNDQARAALIPNAANIFAVRVDCADLCALSADFGIGLNAELAAMPGHSLSNAAPGSTQQVLAQNFIDWTKESGALGGTYARYENGQPLEVHSLGWKDVRLQTPMPQDPILRLASVDKRVGEAVIVYLYNNYNLDPDANVYDILNITPPAGESWGAGVQTVTIDQLRLHKGGIGGNFVQQQSWQDKVAFDFGISADELKAEHMASHLATYDTLFTPGEGDQYSNNGYFLLRYVAEVFSGKTFEELLTEMGTTDVVLAREIAELRPTERGTGYQIFGKETRARWFELDEYIALSASASGLVEFFLNYAAGYERDGSTFNAKPDGQGGGMDGTVSGVFVDPAQGWGIAHINNSDMPSETRWRDRNALVENPNQPEGSCDPTANPGDRFRIGSWWASNWDKHLSIEPMGSEDEDNTSLKLAQIAHGLDNNAAGWESAKWRFYPITANGQTYYRIVNAWKGEHRLHMPAVGQISTANVGINDLSGHWILHDEEQYFRLENREFPGQYLHIESGTLAAAPLNTNWHSMRWYLCN